MCKLKCKLTLASDAATIRPNDEANEGGGQRHRFRKPLFLQKLRFHLNVYQSPRKKNEIPMFVWTGPESSTASHFVAHLVKTLSMF